MSDAPAALVSKLRDPAPLDLNALFEVWEARPPGGWDESPEIYRVLAERILQSGEGEYLLAHEVVTAGLEHWPTDVRLRQLAALSLARSGATLRAQAILQQLLADGHADEQSFGLLARTHKDLWARASDPADAARHLREAGAFYRKAYAAAVDRGAPADHRLWTGINAATTHALLGERERAAAMAREVRDYCRAELKRATDEDGDTYWVLATLGEAALITGDLTEADEWYARATEAARGRFGDLSTTRRQARLLLRHLRQDPSRLDRCLRIPGVVAFAGHMIDRPGRAEPRFPPALESAVYDAIAERLRALDAGFGYASAACGADILFLEAMLARRAEIQVILPYAKDEFVHDSVDVVPGADWRPRFESVLARATRVTTATEQRSPGATVTYDFANMLLEGMATIRAQHLQTALSLVSLWNGRTGDGLGGTATIVRRWQERGRDVQVIDLADMLRTAPPDRAGRTRDGRSAAPRPDAAAGLPKEIVAMLFADAVDYSKLTEEQVPRFVNDFLGAVADLVATSPHRPVAKNTWGDALYFVFPTVADAGTFALDLRDRISGCDWTARGLPGTLTFRIALHAGPVYVCVDPVLGHTSYTGSHVSRAARIEPITPPGQVYASQPFVALAAAQGITTFTWEYVGQVALAKKYGTAPMYHLRRP